MYRQRGAVSSATISTVAFVTICVFVCVWFVMPTGIGQELESNCRVNGLGQGSCLFTNTGWTPGTGCTEVKIVNEGGDSVSSGTVCSGRVWPNDTVERAISIIVGEHCDDRTREGRSWSEVCHMEVENR